jgi:hypothetical protein
MRHLLRKGEPARVSALHGQMSAAVAREAWPYLSAAWRMLDDARARWLDGEELIKVVDFGADWPVLEPLTETLRDFHHASSQPLDQSVQGGTQTDGLLLRKLEPTIKALRKRFEREIEAYIAALRPRDAAHPLLGSVPRDPRVVGAWSVRLAGGGFHTDHVHTHGWLSSAFYVALPSPVPDDAADAGFLTLGQPQSEIGTGLGPLRSIEPKPGRLVLFPSTLWHGTRPFAAGERLTVAFDVA